MRPIIFFHPCNDYTGSTRVLSNVISEKYYNEEVVIVTEKNGNKGFLSEHKNVRIINVLNPKLCGKSIPVLSSFVWRFCATFITILVGWKYKTFYINTLIPYYAALLGRFMGKTIIWHVHEKFVEHPLSVRLIEYVFNNTPAHRIFVSHYVKGVYMRSNSCTEEVIYNRLSKTFVDRVNIRPLEERSRNIISMFSSLTAAKGVDMFVKLAKALPEYSFRLIASTNMKNVEKFISDNNVPSNCQIFPAQSDIHPFLYDTDLMLNLSNPSLWVETFGMTILEAMPYGIPAIVPNIGGPKELVQDGYNGYCVDVRDLDMLKYYIKISLDRENYKRLVKNVLFLYKTKFS